MQSWEQLQDGSPKNWVLLGVRWSLSHPLAISEIPRPPGDLEGPSRGVSGGALQKTILSIWKPAVTPENLVGDLEHEFYDFPYIGNNHPNWRTHIFQRGGSTTNQDLMKLVGLKNVSKMSERCLLSIYKDPYTSRLVAWYVVYPLVI